jgi:hypothetical protein
LGGKCGFLGDFLRGDGGSWAKNGGRGVNMRRLGKIGKKKTRKNWQKCDEICRNFAEMRGF